MTDDKLLPFLVQQSGVLLSTGSTKRFTVDMSVLYCAMYWNVTQLYFPCSLRSPRRFALTFHDRPNPILSLHRLLESGVASVDGWILRWFLPSRLYCWNTCSSRKGRTNVVIRRRESGRRLVAAGSSPEPQSALVDLVTRRTKDVTSWGLLLPRVVSIERVTYYAAVEKHRDPVPLLRNRTSDALN